MQTALNLPVGSLDEAERDFTSKIREHGWFRTSVLEEDDHPGFSYTTGLWLSCGQPELIIFGLKSETVHDVFWDMYRDAKSGIPLSTGQRNDEILGNAGAYVFPLAKRFYYNYLGWSRWFYGGDDFPCLQIVWPDRSGTFPWESGFDQSFSSSQPDLTNEGRTASF